MSGKHNGHKHMHEILDEDHEASVKHRGEAKEGMGGLAEDMSGGYGETSRHEAFKKGGSVHKK